jgi:molybdopterin molybdotransferase
VSAPVSASLPGIEQAMALLDAAIEPLPAVQVGIGAALNRVTIQTVTAACDLPPFDQSAMDGYALRAADAPARLPLAQTVAAGPHERRPRLPEGHACRIYTGGLIPEGADAVVRQEWTRRDGDDAVSIERPTPVGQDIRPQGEELRRGTPLIEAGRRLNAGHVALLSMAGVAELAVRRAPRIRVLVSGDEVIDAGRELRPGEVYNANGPLVSGWLAQAGYRDVRVEHVADTEQAVQDALSRAFAEADLVITTGGVSVGDRDLIAPGAEQLGARRVLWKVAQKPGKPLYVARRGDALLMGLPGNPASVLVNLVSFVRRALDRLEGVAEPGPQVATGVLVTGIKPDSERESWVRVRIESDARGLTRVHPQPNQASHMLGNLASADRLAWVAASPLPLPAGSVVRWIDLQL